MELEFCEPRLPNIVATSEARAPIIDLAESLLLTCAFRVAYTGELISRYTNVIS